MRRYTVFSQGLIVCVLVLSNATYGAKAAASTQPGRPPLPEAPNAHLRETYLGILKYCGSAAKKRDGDYSLVLEPRTNISRTDATILAYLFTARQKYGLTTEMIRKWSVKEINLYIEKFYPDIVNYIGKGRIGFVSDAQKKCFADFLDAGELFSNPPNACLVRDNAFPVHIQPPMWWFAITFNKPKPETFATQYTLSDGKQIVDRVAARFPTACIVGYGPNTGTEYQIAEVKCNIVSNDLSKKAPTEQDIESRTKYSRTTTTAGVAVENGIVPFDGTWHIECPIDMSKVVAYVSGAPTPSTTGRYPPHWKQYETFWIKGSGASLRPGITNSFVRYKPDIDAVKNAYAGSSKNPADPTLGVVGLGVNLQPPNDLAAILTLAGFANKANLKKLSMAATVQTWGAYVAANGKAKGLTAWYFNDIDTATPIAPTSIITKQPYSKFPVYYFSTGIVYIGYNPDTREAFVGEMDEAIIDPEDSHPP